MDNLAGILSRVAEGQGPLKPQQPVGRKADAGANSLPVRPGEIRSCATHASSSLNPEEAFFCAPSPLAEYPPDNRKPYFVFLPSPLPGGEGSGVHPRPL